MGFSLAASQCLIAPPYFTAACWMYATAWASDKYRVRGPVMIVNNLIGTIGLCLMVCKDYSTDDMNRDSLN